MGAVQRDEEEDEVRRPGFGPYKLTPPRLLNPPDPDWALFAEQFRGRGLVLGEGEQATIAEHYRRWLPLAEAIHGIPGVGRFKSTADIMGSFTGSMIDSALSGDHPTALERFNLEDETRFGLSTKTLTLFDGRF